MSVGLLGAVTDEESARTFTRRTQFGRVRVAPRTAYGVARVEQEFGPPGSTVGADGDDGPPAARGGRSARQHR